MRIVCSWCGKQLGEKEPLDDKSESHTRCPECLQRFVNAYTPEKYKQLSDQMRNYTATLKSEIPDEEKNKITIEFSQFLLANYDFLSDEGRKMADFLSEGILKEFEKVTTALPDSKEVRQMKRHLKGARGERLNAAAYIKSLRELPANPPKFYIAARDLFEKHMQHVMDLWTDVVQGNTLSGAHQFCDAGLAGICIEELLVASHLIQHAFANQGLAHMRVVREALDLIELFKKHPQRVEVFIGEDALEKWNKLNPGKVRKTLQKNESAEEFYKLYCEVGSHPTFKALQERVKRMVKGPAEARPSFLMTIGGTLKSKQHWLLTMPVLFLTMAELAAKIVDSFPKFLNQDDCRDKIQEMVDDIQKFQEDYIFKLIRESGADISKIQESSRKSFEKMRSAFRQPEKSV